MADLQNTADTSKPRRALRPRECIAQGPYSKSTFWRRLNAGKIPAYRDGAIIWVWSDDWERHLREAQKVA
jgi:hypothetical protein